jgi:hypothetical protein
MEKTIQVKLRYRRAIALFVLGYIVISVLGAGLAMLLGALMGPPSIETHGPSYILYENALVALNLLGWIPLSLLYFKDRKNELNLRGESLALGILWLVLAVIVDYVLFVFVQSPFYISAHDFYIGQFPWIYIIYIIALVSPLCTTESGKIFHERSVASHS